MEDLAKEGIQLEQQCDGIISQKTKNLVQKTQNLVQNSTTPPLKRKISFRKRRQLPALAKVIKPFRQIYNLHALKLEEGETVKVTKIFENGQCEGLLHGKKGIFPFVNVGRSCYFICIRKIELILIFLMIS